MTDAIAENTHNAAAEDCTSLNVVANVSSEMKLKMLMILKLK